MSSLFLPVSNGQLKRHPNPDLSGAGDDFSNFDLSTARKKAFEAKKERILSRESDSEPKRC